MTWASSVPAGERLLTTRRGDLLAAHLPALREALAQQRDFRREQLAQLDGYEPSGATLRGSRGAVPGAASSPVREVKDLIETGARRALEDIERALARIRTGDYGRCRACDTGIPLVLLVAIPQTTLCLSCQRRSDHTGGRVPAVRSAPTRA